MIWYQILTFVVSLCLAVVIEFVALLPIFALMGTSHGSHAPNEAELQVERLSFILHLPTVLIAWGLDKLVLDNAFLLIVPITQIIFWTVVFNYAGNGLIRRFRKLP